MTIEIRELRIRASVTDTAGADTPALARASDSAAALPPRAALEDMVRTICRQMLESERGDGLRIRL